MIANAIRETTATTSHMPFTEQDQKLIAVFEDNLQASKPYLFDLAEQILDAYPRRKWNMLIGEDTGGRLVTRFLRLVLASQGFSIPTRYICTSYNTRVALPIERYAAYAERLASQMQGSKHVLAITESIGTGNAVRFMNGIMAGKVQSADFAAVSSRFRDNVAIDGELYVGGYGPIASRRVYRTFERSGVTGIRDIIGDVVDVVLPLPIRTVFKSQLAKPSLNGWALSGVRSPKLSKVNEASAQPLAQPFAEPRYAHVAQYCYRAMTELAQEFTDKHGVPICDQISR